MDFGRQGGEAVIMDLDDLPDEVNGWSLSWTAHTHIRYGAHVELDDRPRNREGLTAKATGVVAEDHAGSAFSSTVSDGMTQEEITLQEDTFESALEALLSWLEDNSPEDAREILDDDDNPDPSNDETSSDVDTFALLACSDTKAADEDEDVDEDDVLPAREIYRGQAFLKSRKYVEALDIPYVILSGKYGVLRPDDEISDYDKSVRDRDSEEWREDVLEGLVELDAIVDQDTTRLVVLAPNPYVDPVREDLETGLPVDPEYPIEGLQYGDMLSKLNDMIDEDLDEDDLESGRDDDLDEAADGDTTHNVAADGGAGATVDDGRDDDLDEEADGDTTDNVASGEYDYLENHTPEGWDLVEKDRHSPGGSFAEWWAWNYDLTVRVIVDPEISLSSLSTPEYVVEISEGGESRIEKPPRSMGRGFLPAVDVASEVMSDLLEDREISETDDIVEDRYSRRVDELEERTSLSEREAQVVAAKDQGLGHDRIADEILDLTRSTVDEYSRRARKKVETARATVDEVGGLYD